MIKLTVNFLKYKIKSYWRLFYYRLPLLRNVTGLALILFFALYFIRFSKPLNFQLSQKGSSFQYIQENKLKDIFSSTAALELFDTAPIFIPTRWNYSSKVFPEKRVFSEAEFVSFDPLIEFEESIILSQIVLNSENIESGILYENIFFDPRIFGLFSSGIKQNKERFMNNQLLRVEVIESYDDSEISEIEMFDYVYDLEVDFVRSNLQPIILFLRNENLLVPKPRVYKSSLSEQFDDKILEWLNQPSNLSILPKGFLKLTFYPN